MIGCDNPDVSVDILSATLIYTDHFVLSPVSDRVVPLRLRWTDDEAEGQMVLPEVLAGSQEEVDTQQLDISDTKRVGDISCFVLFLIVIIYTQWTPYKCTL